MRVARRLGDAARQGPTLVRRHTDGPTDARPADARLAHAGRPTEAGRVGEAPGPGPLAQVLHAAAVLLLPVKRTAPLATTAPVPGKPRRTALGAGPVITERTAKAGAEKAAKGRVPTIPVALTDEP